MEQSKIQNLKSKINPTLYASALSGKTIGMIGAGNMGQALLRGLRGAGMSAAQLCAVEANPATRRLVTSRYGVRAVTLEQLAARSDVVLVAVKPQDLRPALQELRRYLGRRASRVLVISIAAGVTTAAIERILGQVAVVRVMPNLAAKVGRAVSAVAPGRWATPRHRRLASAIFQSVGEVVELPERLFDTVTAISGSGPAYFFLIFRALRDAGIEAGIPKRIAERLAIQTALGSAQLVDGLRENLDRLIVQVASKKGTTAAALKVFQRRRLTDILQAGVRAAAKRSKELSETW